MQQKKSNYKPQDNNQIIYKSNSCRAAELSMERKAGFASNGGGFIGGSLTRILGSENSSSSSMINGFSTDLFSQKKRKLSTG